MSVPFAVLLVIIIVLIAGALVLASFLWAIRTKQFSVQHLSDGPYQVFDEHEPVGVPQDMILNSSSPHVKKTNGRWGKQ